MKRLLVIMALLAVAPAAMAVPAYDLSWNFDNDAVGGSAADWTAYTPSWATSNNPAGTTQKVYNASLYAPGSNMPVFDSNKLGCSFNTDASYTGSLHALAQPTNSFIFKTEVFTDIKASLNHWFGTTGMKVLTSWNGVSNAGEVWYEPDGASSSKNLRTGASNIASSQDNWTAGNKRLLVNDGVNGLDNVIADSTNNRPAPATWEVMIKYNTPDNPGTMEFYARTKNYTSWRNAYIGTDGWFKMGWKGATAWHSAVALNLDPATGDYPAATSLELHTAAWTHGFFDNVSFQSVPEPATIGLLLLGLPMLRRRRA